MTRVSLVIDLPTSDYRVLAAIAGRRGVQAHVLVERLVQHAITVTPIAPPPAPTPPRAPAPPPVPKRPPIERRSMSAIRAARDAQFVAVSKLHGQGLSDAEIAAELDMDVKTAWRRRTQLHLPPIGKPGRPKTTQPNAASAAEKS